MLLFEKSRKGIGTDIFPELDVEEYSLPDEIKRKKSPRLPEIAETDVSRHYSKLARNTRGINDGPYLLGSCTMKYNPRLNERISSLYGFKNVHPLQRQEDAQGSIEVMYTIQEYLSEITGMDTMTMEPAAGAQGELTGLLLMKAYHKDRGDEKRTKILIPDSAHGTNPASATMAGYEVVTIKSDERGITDLDSLKAACGDDVAGLMLTNPNTLGFFEENVKEITDAVHDCGGLCYYDGANLNAIVGRVRPGDMGFDIIHLNLHKTFSTPHGGGGPGSGPVGCKKFLQDYLPGEVATKGKEGYTLVKPSKSMGRMNNFYGNFLVYLRALVYIMSNGSDGLPEVSKNAVLNANYLMEGMKDFVDFPYDEKCMHEFIITAKKLKKEKGVTALDIAKGLLDCNMYPPTMYFPLTVDEALMVEPTETESKASLDEIINAFKKVYDMANNNPEELHKAPTTTPIGRVDEVGAARHPIIKYGFEDYDK